jgi:serine acetyltransferase
VKQDWPANRDNPKFLLFLSFYRACQFIVRHSEAPRPLKRGVDAVYRVVNEIGFGFELPLKTVAGPRLCIHHGFGLVVNDGVSIGSDVTLRNGVSIGNRLQSGPVPVLQDGVSVGAGALILGGVVVGRGALIGAGAVVVDDVAAHASVVGNPARPTSSGSVEAAG